MPQVRGESEGMGVGRRRRDMPQVRVESEGMGGGWGGGGGTCHR